MNSDKWSALSSILDGGTKLLKDLCREDRIYFLAFRSFAVRFEHDLLPADMRPRTELSLLLPASVYLQRKPMSEVIIGISSVLSVSKIKFMAAGHEWDVSVESLDEFATRHGQENVQWEVQHQPQESVLRFWVDLINKAKQDIECSECFAEDVIMPLPATQSNLMH